MVQPILHLQQLEHHDKNINCTFNFTINIRLSCFLFVFVVFPKRWWHENCAKGEVLLGQSCYLSEQSTTENGFKITVTCQFSMFAYKFERGTVQVAASCDCVRQCIDDPLP